ncbi:MAG: DUF3685 domain-containing protein [Cyanobacteria bacterium P01_D01_bin.73]
MADASLRLLLIDADPIFRLGLQTGIEELPGVTLVTVGDRPGALTILGNKGATPDPPISVVLVDGITDGLDPNNLVYAPWSLCEEIHRTYPQLPILVLGNGLSEIALIRAQRAGASGYCTKNSSAQRLVAIARQVQRGETVWPALPSLAPKPEAETPSLSQRQPPRSLRLGWNNQGLREIDRELARLETLLTTGALAKSKKLGDRVQKLVAEGRQRELRTARKVLITLSGGFSNKRPTKSSSNASDPTLKPVASVIQKPLSSEPAKSSPNSDPKPALSSGSSAVRSQPSPTLSPAESKLSQGVDDDLKESLVALQNTLFDRCTNKLINAQNNQTGAPLEIDILKPEQRKDLLYLVLRKVDDFLAQIRKERSNKWELGQSLLVVQGQDIQKIWEDCIDDFFQDYATCKVNGEIIKILPILKRDWPLIEQDILSRVVELDGLINHLVFGSDIIADGGVYRLGNVIALERAEALLQNWILCLANAVIQPLINRLSDIESLKYQFFDRRWMATRYVERFRNDLSWKYRLDRYVETPTAIFESRYWLLVSDGRSIEKIPVYASRNEELRSLSGIPLGVTLLLEARDAVAPRLRSAVSFLGQGTLLVLQAVGRGIGLVGRGILQGIGASWQDFRKGNKSEDA